MHQPMNRASGYPNRAIQRFLAVEIAIRREGQADYRVDVWRR